MSTIDGNATHAVQPVIPAAPQRSVPERLLHDSDRAVLDLPIYRFTPEQYALLGEHGIINDHRVELLDGWIVPMTPIGASHALCVEEALEKLRGLVADKGWHVFCQQPITLSNSEPQPDLSIVRGKPRDYPRGHPGPNDVGLVVEVADSTLMKDRRTKSLLYAADGISEFWIINLVDRQIEVYRNPQPATATESANYAVREVVGEAGSVAVALDGISYGSVSLADILP